MLRTISAEMPEVEDDVHVVHIGDDSSEDTRRSYGRRCQKFEQTKDPCAMATCSWPVSRQLGRPQAAGKLPQLVSPEPVDEEAKSEGTSVEEEVASIELDLGGSYASTRSAFTWMSPAVELPVLEETESPTRARHRHLSMRRRRHTCCMDGGLLKDVDGKAEDVASFEHNDAGEAYESTRSAFTPISPSVELPVLEGTESPTRARHRLLSMRRRRHTCHIGGGLLEDVHEPAADMMQSARSASRSECEKEVPARKG